MLISHPVNHSGANHLRRSLKNSGNAMNQREDSFLQRAEQGITMAVCSMAEVTTNVVLEGRAIYV
jgi:hypothetical protein